LRSAQHKGFALVSTLMLLILLSLLCLGMLSLSSISLRSSGQGNAQAEARANARMALMLAIGELQRHSGLDTRVTAQAEVIEPGAPPLTGVWKSWEGENHDSTGRPIQPNYGSKTASGQEGSGRFLGWLVSGAEAGQAPLSPSPNELVSTTAKDGLVPLLSAGTLGSNQGQVHVVPQLVRNGAIAWWASPENQKARLIQPHEPRNGTAAGWSEMANSHAVPDPEPFGLQALLDDPENHTPDLNDARPARKVATLDTTELLVENNAANPQQSFHDLSISAVGLLTNTATGGWRKDLSILSERWSAINTSYPGGALPLFRLKPSAGATTAARRPTDASPTASQSLVYPWSRYPTATTNTNPANPFPTFYMEQHGAVTSWEALTGYATSYKDVNYDAYTGVGTAPLAWARTHRASPWGPSSGNFASKDLYKYLHKNQLAPVLARVQWVFNVRSRRQTPTNPNSTFFIDLLVTPVYTLWNPYNVAISINENYAVAMNKTMSVAIAFAKGTETINYGESPELSTLFRRYTRGSIYDLENNSQYDSSMPGNYKNDWEASNGQGAGFPNSITLAPGEARQFSLAANTPTGNTGVMGVLKEGYDEINSFGFARMSGGAVLDIRNGFKATDTLKFGMRFDNITRLGADSKKQGPGIYMSFGRWAGPDPANPSSAGNNRYLGDGFANYTMMTNLDYSKAYWNEPPDLPTYPVLAIEPSGGNRPWTPVFSIIWGPRFTIGTGAGNLENRPTKGLLQNNPYVNGVLTSSEKLPTNHPANLAFDFSYLGHQPNSDTVPEDGTAGVIATGNTTGNGLSRLIIGEIPMRPIVSLAELQGFDLRARNPIPPFQYNIIGNSDASPMISMDAAVLDPNPALLATNRQHDDSYCANHLLFDDWFFSSIAPEPKDYGKALNKTADEVYRTFLKGERELTNRAYRAIPEDRSLTDSLATQRIAQMINGSDGWLKVASRFEVEGMFNVNSTSVKAWRALLGHARKQQIAHHTKNGVALTDNKEDHVVSRFSVAADIKAGAGVGMSGAFPNSSEYTGFRTLNDRQLDELAEKIVEQVRKRGPFLSLSEFINRKLDNNEELALAGAVQTALNSLSDDPHKLLKDEGYASKTMDPADAKMKGADYKFAKAAEGYDTYGMPGWIRQADVLRPLAPILSARDDTFTIRAYGDARDGAGNITARAWCEATVRRGRDFVDPQDLADSIDPPASEHNKVFGRRYSIVSFRWISPDEV
jgi:hypothetical protein